ncbi:hypothetical protein Trydic_g1279 [Trypoxylus dichotomus]
MSQLPTTKKKIIVMVSLDLEKAFDKIHHEGLLLKIKYSRFPTKILKTVRIYLYNRRFHTIVNFWLLLEAREVKEEKRGSTSKTSRTQEDTQMPPASSRREDTGRRRTEEVRPAN